MNAKIYNGNVQPNHKEFKIWVNDEGIIKTWNGTEWIEQSGASSSGSGEASTVEYLDLRGYDVMNEDSKWSVFAFYSISCIVITNNNYKAYMPSGMLAQLISAPNSNYNVLACAIDFSVKTSVFLGKLQTINEYITQELGSMSLTQEELNSIPRLTKEQFYNLEA